MNKKDYINKRKKEFIFEKYLNNIDFIDSFIKYYYGDNYNDWLYYLSNDYSKELLNNIYKFIEITIFKD